MSSRHYPLHSTASTQEDPSGNDLKVVYWDIKNQNTQKKIEKSQQTMTKACKNYPACKELRPRGIFQLSGIELYSHMLYFLFISSHLYGPAHKILLLSIGQYKGVFISVKL